MIQLSVIIPVYNVGKYIRQCLDSLMSSTFQEWECILVDDGSIDDSGIICDEYVKTDSRFKVIHKINGGVSSARNLGLDNASGKWVTFIDADDFVSPTFIECLYEPIKEHPDLDFVHGGCSNWSGGKVTGINQQYDDYVGSDMAYLFNKFRGLTVSKLFSLENVKQWSDGLPLRFDENLTIAEDMLFTINYFLTVRKFAFSSEIGYYYRRDNNVSLTKTIKRGAYEKSLYSWKQIYYSLINVCMLNNINPLSLEHRRSVMGDSLTALTGGIYQFQYPRSQRIKHLKEDFSDKEIEYLKYSTNTNIIVKLSNNSLIDGQYWLFDLIHSVYHTIIVCGSFVKHKVLNR